MSPDLAAGMLAPMAKPDEVEPLYAGLKDSKPAGVSLPVRVAIAALFLGFLFWIVWLQAH